MTTPLTAEHVIAAFHSAALIYNQPFTAEAGVLIHRVIMDTAPDMTSDLFDWGMSRVLATCRFMPRVVDILEACYERDTTDLPRLPDIDPRYASEPQQSLYYRALEQRNRALAVAPVDTSKPKAACQHLAPRRQASAFPPQWELPPGVNWDDVGLAFSRHNSAPPVSHGA